MGLSLTNLISHWKLDESSGSRADSHGSNTLTDDSSVGSTTGIVGSAANFVATSSDSLSRADNTDLRLSGTDASITLWVKLTSKTADQIFVSKWASGFDLEYGVQYQQSGDRFRLVVGNGTTNFVATSNSLGSPSTGVWYFIQCRIDNTAKTAEICVNTAGWDSVTFTGTIKNGTNTFYVGRRNNATPNYADAEIDELSIWKRKLTDDEFSFLYNGGSGRSYPWQPEYKYPSLRNAVAGYMAGRDTGAAASDQFTTDGSQDGTLTNGATRVDNGGLAYSFDGVDDVITVGTPSVCSNLPAANFTFAAWLYATSQGEGSLGTIVDKYSTAGWYILLRGISGSSYAVQAGVGYNAGDRTQISGNNLIVQNNWTHLAVTWDSSLRIFSLYINGSLQTFGSVASPSGTLRDDSTVNLCIGNRNATDRTWGGLLDDALIYPRALTSTEIANLASARGAAYQQTGTRRRRSTMGAGIL